METRNCQNCKNDFTIESEDFSFYEKIKVPPPTFCPECRTIRRMTWRNERSLYKRGCDLCNKNFIAVFSDKVSFPVYCKECWWSDNWDAEDYGIDLDLSKPFLLQFKELLDKVPRLGVWARNVTNSDFANMIGECKNMYLTTSAVHSEDIYYSRGIDYSKNIFDSLATKNSENCYQNIECDKNYSSYYMYSSKNCIDSYFLYDCVNCSNCVMSFGLRNKSYCIRNVQHSKEDYFVELEKINLHKRNSLDSLREEFEKSIIAIPRRFANQVKALDSYGDNLTNVKNCKHCFDVYDAENLKYCYRSFSNMRDSMDCDLAVSSELMYEYTTGALNDYKAFFCCCNMGNTQNSEYSHICQSVKNIFGCISLKKKENMILNKKYSEEEYHQLREKIISNMMEHPYIGTNNKVYRYGEFLPSEFSPFSYNETIAQEFFPISKEKAMTLGYSWKEFQNKNVKIDIQFYDLPEAVEDIGDDILGKAISCAHKEQCHHNCTGGFKIISEELNFYRKNKIPLPILCPNCRHFERLLKVNPLKLWHRQCMCDKSHAHHKGKCEVEFETSYAPNRPEIVYCEKCYQQEVY